MAIAEGTGEYPDLILQNLRTSAEILEKKITNSYFVVNNLPYPDYRTPPNAYHPEGRSPQNIKPLGFGNQSDQDPVTPKGLIICNVQSSIADFEFRQASLEALEKALGYLYKSREALRFVEDIMEFIGSEDRESHDRLIRSLELQGASLYEGSVRAANYEAYETAIKTLALKRSPLEDKTEDSEKSLPRLEVLEAQRAVHIADTDNIIRFDGKFIPWEIFLHLAKNPRRDITSLQLSEVAENAGSIAYSAGPPVVRTLRKLFAQVPIQDLIMASGPLNERTYRLDARVFINGKEIGAEETGNIGEEVNTGLDSRVIALKRFARADTPAPTFEEMQDILGTKHDGKVLLPQNILFALGNALVTLQGRVDSHLATDKEIEVWGEMKRRIDEADNYYALLQYKEELKSWYSQQKYGHLNPQAELIRRSIQESKPRRNEIEELIEELGSNSRDGQICESDLVRIPGISFSFLNNLMKDGVTPKKTGKNPVYNRDEVRLILCVKLSVTH